MDLGPLGSHQEDDEFDLTAKMEEALHTYQPGRGSEDGDDVDLGDAGSLSMFQQQRSSTHHATLFQPQSQPHTPPTSAPAGDPLASAAPPPATDEVHPDPLQNAQQQPSDFTYNQLVQPPSYEESVLYEPVPVPPLPVQQENLAPTQAYPPPPPEQLPAHQQQQQQQQPQPTASDPLLLPPLMPTRMQAQAPLAVSVTHPMKREQTGMFGLKGGFVSYLVTTRVLSDAPGFTAGQQFSERRRFNDFVALSDALKVRLRGYFLPPRPHKSLMLMEGGQLMDGFIEERRAALEKYLQKLVMHEASLNSEELQLFLKAEGDLGANPAWVALQPIPSAGFMDSTAKLSKQLLGWESQVVDPVQAVQPTKHSSDMLRAVREASQARQQAGTDALPPGEVQLRREREKLEAGQNALLAASRAAVKLTQCMDKCGLVYADLGLALFKASKAEGAEGMHLAHFTGTIRQCNAISHGCKQAGTSSVRVSRISNKAVSKTAWILEALHEHLNNMAPAIKGLHTREEQLLTANTIQADIESRNTSVRQLEVSAAKFLGGVSDPKQAKRMEEYRNDISKLEYSLTAAKAEYERIAAINQQELARLHKEQQGDLLHMVHAFATTQLMSAEREAEVWLGLASEQGAPSEALAPIRSTIMATQQGQQQQQQAQQQHQAQQQQQQQQQQ